MTTITMTILVQFRRFFKITYYNIINTYIIFQCILNYNDQHHNKLYLE